MIIFVRAAKMVGTGIVCSALVCGVILFLYWWANDEKSRGNTQTDHVFFWFYYIIFGGIALAGTSYVAYLSIESAWVMLESAISLRKIKKKT